MNSQTQEWYASWFDTPYYHILYRDRDYSEAGNFMFQLTQRLELPKTAHIMDLACGRGRHSIYLNRLGYQVTGVDLSHSSIAFAKAQLRNNRLPETNTASDSNLLPIDPSRIKFEVHNMTEAYDGEFDAVFNLFTSFGYFNNPSDNLNTICAIKANLKPNAYAIIDFMNVNYVIKNLVAQNQKTEQGITFTQKRRYENGSIYKDIFFTDNNRDYHFTERVNALKLEDFQSYFDKTGLELIDLYGDYYLNNFHEEDSERLIMVLRK